VIPVRYLTVVVRKTTAAAKVPGGLEGFKKLIPNRTLREDTDFISASFMSGGDCEDFSKQLEAEGLVLLEDGAFKDIAIFDFFGRGPTAPCHWPDLAVEYVRPT